MWCAVDSTAIEFTSLLEPSIIVRSLVYYRSEFIFPQKTTHDKIAVEHSPATRQVLILNPEVTIIKGLC